MTIIAQRSQYYRVPRYPASSASIPAKVAGDRLRRVLGVLVAAGAATNLSSLLAAGDSAAVDETLRSGIARRGIPAVVGMVASEHKRIYAGAFGKRDASGVPVHVDCIFAIASMTKAITTVAALQLVEQGKVDLAEPVAGSPPQLANLDVLEGFDAAGKPSLRPAKTPLTLRRLLTHTSGLCYDTWDGNTDGPQPRQGRALAGRLRLNRLAFMLSPEHQPK